MRLGILPLPLGVWNAVTGAIPVGTPAVTERDAQGRIIWREGDGAIPIAQLEEIGVTATRDYLPAVIAGLILLYALTDGRKKGKR